MIIQPIIIPVSNEPDTCPECGKIEKKKEVCSYCDYEYKEEKMSAIEVIIAFMIIVLILSIIVFISYNILTWVTCDSSWEHCYSLFERFKNSFKHLFDLQIF